jgi:hypothetical protein
MVGLLVQECLYGLNGRRAYFVIALSLVTYGHAICEITQFYRTFLENPHIPNTKLSCFSSMSCDDDGPVGQTGSEAALKPENVATMAQPS